MQLNCFYRTVSCTGGAHRKWIRVMQLTAIFLLAAGLQVAAHTAGQTVTLKVNNAPLKQVFVAIQQQTGFSILVDQKLVEQSKPVSLDVQEMPLSEVMALCLQNQSLEYEIESQAIIVKKREVFKPVEDDVSPVKGRVVNDKGEPVEGVSVTVKGSNVGTSTNANGEFFLDDIDENAVLVFTHTSIEKIEQKRNNRNELTIGVKVRTSILDEVQVIPYGTQTKRFSVGNVTTVKGEDIAKQPVNNPLLALQGRVPGLFITQNTGVAGGSVTERVQRPISIAKGNEPDYVIDGVPYYLQLPKVGFENIILGGNPLNFINPADIESIEVLKDADATAIYGSRAANGAILITTKKGKAGRMALDVNIQQGWGKV